MKKTSKIALIGGILAVALIIGIGLVGRGIMTAGDPPFTMNAVEQC